VVERSNDKLAQARFHLKHLTRHTNAEQPSLLAVKSYLSGCVSATRAAFEVLQGSHGFASVYGTWLGNRERSERRFFDYMLQERNLDLHEGRTTLHRNFSIQPGGEPIPPEYRLRGPGKASEVVGTCRRYIALVDDLLNQFR
jgi:hypothetical protein